MGFIRNLFRQASEFQRLDAEVSFYKEQLGKAEWKVEQLEKQVQTERRKYDKFVITSMNQISVQHKLPGKFQDIEAEKPPVAPPEAPAKDELAIEYLAQQMRDDDIRRGMTPSDMEAYKDAIKSKPEQYGLVA